jgi:hypothetical protein
MVIHDLNFPRALIAPPEHDPPLIVYSDRMLSRQVPLQDFQAISRLRDRLALSRCSVPPVFGVRPWQGLSENRWNASMLENQRRERAQKAPVYGLRLHPSAFASADLLADSAAQILHQRHHPIEGLYAVGNAAAHNEYDIGYQAGHSLTSGMTFGYLAALHIRAGSNVLTPCYL